MRRRHGVLYVGISDSAFALDAENGAEVWRAKLGGSAFVNVLWDGEALYASSKGEVWRLDPKSGAIIWHNKMKGLGTGPVTLVSERLPSAPSGHAVASEAQRVAHAAQ